MQDHDAVELHTLGPVNGRDHQIRLGLRVLGLAVPVALMDQRNAGGSFNVIPQGGIYSLYQMKWYSLSPAKSGD